MLRRYWLASGQLHRINGSAAKPSTIVQTVLVRMFAFAHLISDSAGIMWVPNFLSTCQSYVARHKEDVADHQIPDIDRLHLGSAR
ncbi:hypothetical protein MA20_46805 [Bradyrhizobium japonicum]|uniref:Uncharacterized protein n=3 Tax=Bradyrhizobium TaxID=374 RepID=A0A2U8P167_9BRAD|nr:hypothetical protein RN69_38320 [Bradyrhizobium japonicum]AWL91415.1 hypothetical protein CIT37_03280 [Bradyrhizobium ottawaense]KGT73038.1 hypothetical protein MA20_46805 [Bradyrhizobium japonicum]MYV88208.1 hypothetical protein [Bradyrhizobium japonicum]BAL13139.1 hypothetical protein BJ6T_78930 [Bradyrhizobium japonicum USDA 6]